MVYNHPLRDTNYKDSYQAWLQAAIGLWFFLVLPLLSSSSGSVGSKTSIPNSDPESCSITRNYSVEKQEIQRHRVTHGHQPGISRSWYWLTFGVIYNGSLHTLAGTDRSKPDSTLEWFNEGTVLYGMPTSSSAYAQVSTSSPRNKTNYWILRRRECWLSVEV